MFLIFITARKLSLGQGNIFAPVCHSVHSEDGGLPQCMLGYHPTPWEQTPSWEQTPPGTDTPTPQEQTSPWDQTTPPGADTPPDHTPGTRPPLRNACWEIRAIRGRYASYWNAILFSLFLGQKFPHLIIPSHSMLYVMYVKDDLEATGTSSSVIFHSLGYTTHSELKKYTA